MITPQQAKIQTLGLLVKLTFEGLSRPKPKKVESKTVNAIVTRKPKARKVQK